jgi:hypothetical protein
VIQWLAEVGKIAPRMKTAPAGDGKPMRTWQGVSVKGCGQCEGKRPGKITGKVARKKLFRSSTLDAASVFVGDFTVVEEAIRSHIELSQTVFP